MTSAMRGTARAGLDLLRIRSARDWAVDHDLETARVIHSRWPGRGVDAMSMQRRRLRYLCINLWKLWIAGGS
jgi:hypothetical protein